jgi:hypothetical protein
LENVAPKVQAQLLLVVHAGLFRAPERMECSFLEAQTVGVAGVLSQLYHMVSTYSVHPSWQGFAACCFSCQPHAFCTVPQLEVPVSVCAMLGVGPFKPHHRSATQQFHRFHEWQAKPTVSRCGASGQLGGLDLLGDCDLFLDSLQVCRRYSPWQHVGM